MNITDLKPGQFATRYNWKDSLVVYKNIDDSLQYLKNTTPGSLVAKSSSIYGHEDFYLCDILGNKLTQKEITMETTTFENAKVIVMDDAGNITVSSSEEIALENIAEQLERYPRRKFTMFEPYQQVKPKQVDLSSLITKIKK